MKNQVIKVRGLTKKFGNFNAVNSIDFDVFKGEILGFLGPNGAGKTTTIKILNGLLKKSSGTVDICGYNTESQMNDIKKITGYMSQKFSLYPLLTSEENIRFFAGLSGFKRAEISSLITEAASLIGERYFNLKVSEIPPGVRQKVSLFVCLLGNPEIIFLDEPTSGVDPKVRRDFWLDIYELKERGKTIVVTTHNLDEVEYCDRMLILHRGNIILEGNPETKKREKGFSSIHELFRDAVENSGIEAGV